MFSPIQKISRLTYESSSLLSCRLVNDITAAAASTCTGQLVLLCHAHARDLGVAGQWIFDQRREGANEGRQAFESVCSLGGDRKTRCNRHDWMFGLISLLLFETSEVWLQSATSSCGWIILCATDTD